MDSTILIFIITFFGLLGMIGLFATQRISTYFGTVARTADQRNELRAVYGGLSLGMAILGILSFLPEPALDAQMALFVYAVLLLCMAGARLLSLFFEEKPTHKTYVFLAIELVLGAAAIAA